MFIRQNKGQSMLEYAILLGVVVAALLIMQAFVKRGYQGGLKESADKMGEQFSAGGTTTREARSLKGNQVVTEDVATTSDLQQFTTDPVTSTLDKGVYSYTNRDGAETEIDSKSATDSAKQEKTRWGEYQADEATDFTAPF